MGNWITSNPHTMIMTLFRSTTTCKTLMFLALMLTLTSAWWCENCGKSYDLNDPTTYFGNGPKTCRRCKRTIGPCCQFNKEDRCAVGQRTCAKIAKRIARQRAASAEVTAPLRKKSAPDKPKKVRKHKPLSENLFPRKSDNPKKGLTTPKPLPKSTTKTAKTTKPKRAAVV